MQPPLPSNITGKWGDSMLEKVPPHSDQAEEAVIGSCLIGGLAIVNEAREIVSAGDFRDDRRRKIWEAIVDMADKQVQIDFVTVQEKLRNDTESIGGVSYILHLAGVVPTTAHIKNYAEIVRKKSLARQKIRQCYDIAEKLYNDEDPVEIISRDDSRTRNSLSTNRKSDITYVRNKVFEVYAAWKIEKENDGIVGIPTGYSDLDRKIGGLRKGTYTS